MLKETRGILIAFSSTVNIAVIFLKKEIFFFILTSATFYQKMVKLLCFARFIKVAAINISESKLDELVLSSEDQTEHYDLICLFWYTHGSGLVCVIRNGLSYKLEPSLSLR